MNDTTMKSGGLRGKIKKAGWGILAIAFLGGIIFWGGFNTAMEMTNREEFCISCHEMKDNVYQEYRNTIHYSNRTGVRATCPDCHVPKDWTHKIIRKIQASNEVFHKLLGSIDTPEKFNAKRLELAEHEWARMKTHGFARMPQLPQLRLASIIPQQGRRSNSMHQKGFAEGKTCIDCHKGIAHTLPAVEQNIGATKNGAPPEIFHPSTAAPKAAVAPSESY